MRQGVAGRFRAACDGTDDIASVVEQLDLAFQQVDRFMVPVTRPERVTTGTYGFDFSLAGNFVEMYGRQCIEGDQIL